MPEHWVSVRRVRYSGRFAKAFQRLPTVIQQRFRTKERLFVDNPAHPSLRTHRLRGKLQAFHSFSISESYRVIFQRDAVDAVSLLDIGTHAVYQ